MQLDLPALMVGSEMRQATGALVIRRGAEECRLYYMFGRLYHAEGPGGVEGEAAVDVARSWSDFEHEFETGSRLPTRETIGDEAVSEDDLSLAAIARREAEQLRRRALYFFAFLIVAAALMVFFFTRRT